jgi:hypothetical protein
MDENVSLKQLIDELTSVSDDHVGGHAPIVHEKLDPIGRVMDIAGSGSQARWIPSACSQWPNIRIRPLAMSARSAARSKMRLARAG